MKRLLEWGVYFDLVVTQIGFFLEDSAYLRSSAYWRKYGKYDEKNFVLKTKVEKITNIPLLERMRKAISAHLISLINYFLDNVLWF